MAVKKSIDVFVTSVTLGPARLQHQALTTPTTVKTKISSVNLPHGREAFPEARHFLEKYIFLNLTVLVTK